MLDGIPGQVPGYRRLSPLQGLMVSRYPGAYALTSASEGLEFHQHKSKVIRVDSPDPLFMTLGSFHDGTNRTPAFPQTGQREQILITQRDKNWLIVAGSLFLPFVET